jgi:peptide methionine sulfoxide reductase MsrB
LISVVLGGSSVRYDTNMVERVVNKTDEEWKKHLTAEQYQICRRIFFRKNMLIPKRREYTCVYVVVNSIALKFDKTKNSILTLLL